MLEIKNITTCYGRIEGVRNVSMEISQGETVALLGSNGAGKTTVLKTIAGLLSPVTGQVKYMGETISGIGADRVIRKNICYIPEGRGIFAGMTIMENLEMGAYLRRDRKGIAHDMEQMFTYFPILKERSKQFGGTLSGGEQQMLAIARGLMTKPNLLMLDEPSLGLAPLVIHQIAEIITRLGSDGMTILLVEQNANLALKLSRRAYVLEKGSITLSGDSEKLLADDHIKEAYLGGSENC